MRRPPASAMLSLALALALCVSWAAAVVGAAPSTDYGVGVGVGGGGVAPPSSIYAYTIATQNQQPNRQPPQHVLSNDISYTSNNNNNNNKNPINYNTNPATNYRSGNTNRNFYYTATATAANSNSNNVSHSNNSGTNNGNSKSRSKDIFRGPSATSSSASSTSPADASGAPLGSAAAAVPGPAPASDCSLDRLAVYKVVLHTYWTRELFPKHYPDWRPTAQWTKTIGRTHDSNYALYHIGQQATPGVKQFAETGKADMLDSMAAQQQQQQQQQQSQQGNSFTSFVPTTGAAPAVTKSPSETPQQQQQQQQPPLLQHGERSVFDEFAIPAITTGAGRSEAKFFVDSNHSLVSLMTRIVPSPDWFIGVDSFQLCVGGSWIDTVTVEMDPLDAGTDNGFTFTAPNWPTSPQGVIYRITSRYPAHPAGSFFYPKSKRLPPMATFQFIKLKEYELSEVFNFAEDDRKYETVQTQTHLESEHNHVEMNNELSASIERERQNEVTPGPTSVTERDRIRSQLLAKMNPMNNASSPSVVPKNDKDAIIDDIVQSYQKRREGADGANGSSARPRYSRRRVAKRSRDCRVSHWSEWSACSKSCGIGEMHRYRKVIKHGRRGGRPCPALQESKWCGSEKGCHKTATYFNWSNT